MVAAVVVVMISVLMVKKTRWEVVGAVNVTVVIGTENDSGLQKDEK